MTPYDIAVQLAPLLGSSTQDQVSSLNGINLDDSDKAAIAIAITQALQEIFGLGPTALSEQLYGSVLRPPVNVSFTATQYSTTISGFATWADWMQGCTVQGGDGEDNELISATELVRPYMAASGTANGTVYADAIRLPDWVKNTMDPIWTPRIPMLRPAMNREGLRFYNSPYIGDLGHQHYPSHGAFYTSRNKTAGEPVKYLVESRYDPSTGALPLFMRFNPMPGQATPITFRVKRKPPVITVADLMAQTATVNGTPDGALDGLYRLDPTLTARVTLVGPAGYLFRGPGDFWFLTAFANGVPGDMPVTTPGWFLATADALNLTGTYTPDSTTGTPAVVGSVANPINIPTDWNESILLPFAKRWFIGHPSFGNPSAAAQIMQQSQVAKATLESFIPQITPTRAIYR